MDTATMEATERWFLARGLPHFIADYSASRDVLTRAVPFLTLVFVVEVGGALSSEWTWWQNLLAAAGGLAFLLAVWGGVNRLRGRRALQRPDSVGPVELTVFVVVPALVPLVFNGQVGQALAVAAVNLTLLGTVYFVTSYGLVPLTRWATAKMFHELRALFDLLIRALPLLLLFVTFLFVNTEVWQVAGSLEAPFLAATVGLFVVLGGVFLTTRLPAEIGRLAQFDSVHELTRLCAGTPAGSIANGLGEEALDPAPLGRRQRGNVALVVLVSEGIQVTLVAVLIAAFFVLFGLVAIRPPVIEAWLGGPGDVLVDLSLFGKQVVLTAELLRVATFLGAFSGFYFTVYVITDAKYREEFFNAVVAEVRESLAVRAVYLAGQPGQPGQPGQAATG